MNFLNSKKKNKLRDVATLTTATIMDLLNIPRIFSKSIYCSLITFSLILAFNSVAVALTIDVKVDRTDGRITNGKITGLPPNSTVVVDGKEYTADENGELILPSTAGGYGTDLNIEAGRETFPPVTDSGPVTSDQQAQANSRDGGGGIFDPEVGPPPPFFDLSKEDIINLTYFRTITPLEGSPVSLNLVDFNIGFQFIPTNDSSFFDVKLTNYNFLYESFSIPEIGFFDVQKEVLDESIVRTGTYDISTGKLSIGFDTQWLSTGNLLIAHAYNFFDITVTDIGQNFSEFLLGSQGNIPKVKAVPEPTSILSLLALGTLGAASTLKRKLKSSKSTGKETTKVG